MRCIKTLAPQIDNPNCASKILMNIWWGKFRRLVEFLGLGPWCMVKFVVEFLWICLKRKIQENKNVPILRRKLRCIP